MNQHNLIYGWKFFFSNLINSFMVHVLFLLIGRFYRQVDWNADTIGKSCFFFDWSCFHFWINSLRPAAIDKKDKLYGIFVNWKERLLFFAFDHSPHGSSTGSSLPIPAATFQGAQSENSSDRIRQPTVANYWWLNLSI